MNNGTGVVARTWQDGKWKSLIELHLFSLRNIFVCNKHLLLRLAKSLPVRHSRIKNWLGLFHFFLICIPSYLSPEKLDNFYLRNAANEVIEGLVDSSLFCYSKIWQKLPSLNKISFTIIILTQFQRFEMFQKREEKNVFLEWETHQSFSY